MPSDEAFHAFLVDVKKSIEVMPPSDLRHPGEQYKFACQLGSFNGLAIRAAERDSLVEVRAALVSIAALAWRAARDMGVEDEFPF